jgi:sec-independent protein translocase protein TatA
MGELQPWHIILIVLVFLLLFGSKRLPDGARALGRSLRIFKSEVKSMHDDDENEQAAQAAQVPPPLPPAAAQPVPPTVPPAERPQATTAQQPPQDTVPVTSAGPTGQPPAAS